MTQPDVPQDRYRGVRTRSRAEWQNIVLAGTPARSRRWRERRLGDVLRLKRGYDLPKRRRLPGSVPVVSSSGITDSHLNSKVQGPGVVIGRYGTLGEVHFVAGDYWPLNTTLYVEDFKGNDPRYVGYLLETIDIRPYSDKAAVPGLNRNHLHEERIQFTSSPSQQRAIAHILGALDDKIELNRRMNETLEAMAQALFRSWFLDFDPVHAKIEGRDIGLSLEISDLFPNTMMDSATGLIPKGWSFFRLDQLADHHTRSVAPYRSPEIEFEHFSIPAHDAGRIAPIEKGKAIKSNKTVVPPDSVLLSKLNPEIQRVWIPVASNGRQQICSTEFLAFTPRYPATRSLLFSLFANSNFQEILRSMVTGTSKSHQRVPPKALKQQNVLCGTPDLFLKFDEQTAPLLAQTIRNRAESQTLEALRDGLLPKLISGEIRLHKIENLEGEACTG